MRQQKSHDIDAVLRSDAQRLVTTLLAVAAIVTLLYFVEQKYNFVKRFVVLPETQVLASPILSTETKPQQTPAVEAKKQAE